MLKWMGIFLIRNKKLQARYPKAGKKNQIKKILGNLLPSPHIQNLLRKLVKERKMVPLYFLFWGH